MQGQGEQEENFFATADRLRHFQNVPQIPKKQNIHRFLSCLALNLNFDVDIAEPDSLEDDTSYVKRALGDEEKGGLGWTHPVARVCVALTQSVMAVASCAVILTVSKFNGGRVLTDGIWEIEIKTEEEDPDLVCVNHKRHQVAPSFTVAWSMDLKMRVDRTLNSIKLEEAKLRILEDECRFPADDRQRVEILRALSEIA
jgi:hypothetical protein